MQTKSIFFREQEAIQRDLASVAILVNAKEVATRAAGAWAREAARAERMERRAVLRLALPPSTEDEARIFSENPDRGLTA